MKRLLIGVLVAGFMFSGAVYADYQEDFSTDPQFTIVNSTNVEGKGFAEWSNGSFHSQVQDQPSDWLYIGISPRFTSISHENDFTVKFDFNPVTVDWGHYPGIYFVPSMINSVDDWRNIDNEDKIMLTIQWSDHVYKKFTFTIGGENYRSPSIPATNEWYHVEIQYNSSASTANLTIKRENGTVFYEETNINAPLRTSIEHIAIGEIQGSTKYGDLAEIKIDNISIDSGGCPSIGTGYDEGVEAGKQFCKDNPAACGLENSGSYDRGYAAGNDGCDECPAPGDDRYDEGYAAGLTEGRAGCNTTPPTDGCASFDLFTNILHVPCLDMGAVSYWLDLELQGNHLEIKEYDEK